MEGGILTPTAGHKNESHCMPTLKKRKLEMPTGLSNQMRSIWGWDEHVIGTELLCERLGYKSDYYFKAGLTNAFVKI